MKIVFANILSDRLRKLYESQKIDLSSRGWSSEVARNMLQRGVILYNSPDIPESEYARKKQVQKISHTLKEHISDTQKTAADISGKWLEIYRQYFGCSAAYLFGEIDSFTPEYKTVQDITGLSPEAVKQLQLLNKSRRIMPVAVEMHDTLDLILTDAGYMADILRAIGMVAGTVHSISGDDIPEFPDMDTADPAFIRVVEKERLYMAAENLSKIDRG